MNNISNFSILQAVFSIRNKSSLKTLNSFILLFRKNPVVFVSHDTMASSVGLQRRQIVRITNELQELGILYKNKLSKYGTCLYELNPEIWKYYRQLYVVLPALMYLFLAPVKCLQINNVTQRKEEQGYIYNQVSVDPSDLGFVHPLHPNLFINGSVVSQSSRDRQSSYNDSYREYVSHGLVDGSHFGIDRDIPSDGQILFFTKILEELEKKPKEKEIVMNIAPLVVSPVMSEMTDALHLTIHGQAKLMSFTDDILVDALQRLKQQSTVNDPFRWLVEYCTITSAAKGIKPDWKSYYMIMERYSIPKSSPFVDGKSVTVKQQSSVTKKNEFEAVYQQRLVDYRAKRKAYYDQLMIDRPDLHAKALEFQSYGFMDISSTITKSFDHEEINPTMVHQHEEVSEALQTIKSIRELLHRKVVSDPEPSRPDQQNVIIESSSDDTNGVGSSFDEGPPLIPDYGYMEYEY